MDDPKYTTPAGTPRASGEARQKNPPLSLAELKRQFFPQGNMQLTFAIALCRELVNESPVIAAWALAALREGEIEFAEEIFKNWNDIAMNMREK